MFEGPCDVECPCGTESPTHTDPRQNLLAQVVGYKQVVLFPLEAVHSLYPMQSNTGQVDMKQATMVKTDFHNDTLPFPLFHGSHAFFVRHGTRIVSKHCCDLGHDYVPLVDGMSVNL